MLEYEAFVLKSFPKVFSKYYLEAEESIPCPIEKAKIKAIFYLEVNCNGKYGFFAEAHSNEKISKSNSVVKIPASLDSALLLPYIMNEGVDQLVVETLISVLKRSRQSSGFWNLVFDTDHKPHSLIPGNVDTTALAAMALYNTGSLSLNDCRVLGKKIGEHLLVEPGQVHKLCVGVVTNLLWFLATIGLETEPQFIDSVNLVHSFVDKLIDNKCENGLELSGIRFYTNKYTHLFFIARFLQKSENAREIFGQKFVEFLVSEFEYFVKKPKTEALDIAFMILAAWHLGLHKTGDGNKWLGNESEIVERIRENVKTLCNRLLSLQDKKDGSFKAWVTYQWNNMNHWGGTKAITTGFVVAASGIAKREIYEEMECDSNGDSSDGQSSNDDGTKSR